MNNRWHESRNDGFQRYFINENGKRQEVRLYKIWDGIYQRCYNPNQKDFYRYGGRGIVLCDEWKNSTAFMSWAYTNGYDDSLQIDRIDVNGIPLPINRISPFSPPSNSSLKLELVSPNVKIPF